MDNETIARHFERSQGVKKAMEKTKTCNHRGYLPFSCATCKLKTINPIKMLSLLIKSPK